MSPILSICIATKNRRDYLEETLLSIINQKSNLIEIVILDSSVNNQTFSLIEKLYSISPNIKYIKNEKLNLDEGYDEAVKHANGLYCWLLPDDDILMENSISVILKNIESGFDLILLNLLCYNKEMTLNLQQNLKNSETDLFFYKHDFNIFLSEMGVLLSYLGSVIIKKSIWVSTNRETYYGSWFVHVGVILGSEDINKIMFISSPLIKYRSGNSSWTAKSFEIWYLKWPELIWSFSNFKNEVKDKIAPRQSWNMLYKLIKSRAMGEYNYKIYKKYIANSNTIRKYRFILISRIPVIFLNSILVIYCSLFRRGNKFTIYNLIMSSPNKNFSFFLARMFVLRFI